MKQKTYYHILNISPRATDNQVRAAYRALALRWHPDRNPQNHAQAQRMFSLVNHAYMMLQTAPQRRAYSRRLLALQRPQAQHGNVRKFLICLREIFWPFALKEEARHG